MTTDPVTAVVTDRVVCHICDHLIDIGQLAERWPWAIEGGDGECQIIIVHPDCWRLMEAHNKTHWFVGDTWYSLLDELSDAQLEAERDACVDPSCSARIERRRVIPRDFDDEDDGAPR